jgi:hypothetical protein
MKRRTFLTGMGTAIGGGVGLKVFGNQAETANTSKGEVFEPARKIPIHAEADVLVVGGGPAGVAASVAAGRMGAKVILLERYNHLGGLWTGGLVLPLLSNYGTNEKGEFHKVLGGIGEEISQKLFGMDMAIREVNPVVDPEASKYLFDVMTRDAGVEVFYHCWASNVIMEGSCIRAVIVESKSGRRAFLAKTVVDCTGDGDIYHFAGEAFENLHFDIGLVHRLGNINTIDPSKPGYRELKLGKPTPIEGVHWVNMRGAEDVDNLDMDILTQLQQEYRIKIWEKLQKIRQVPGHEHLFLLDTASQLGVRMSRILKGRYILTLDDTMTFRKFEDVIGISGAWIDISHGGGKVSFRNRPEWQIPYRSLLPQNTENLLVAGRCMSAEAALAEDARIIATCLVTGHGAGVGAAIAARTGDPVSKISVTQLQKTLREQDANLG